MARVISEECAAAAVKVLGPGRQHPSLGPRVSAPAAWHLNPRLPSLSFLLSSDWALRGPQEHSLVRTTLTHVGTGVGREWQGSTVDTGNTCLTNTASKLLSTQQGLLAG